MNQEYRRKFLALDTLRGDEVRLRQQLGALIADVRSAPIDRRPYTDDVRDALMSIGLATSIVSDLTNRYELAVWGAALTR